MKIFRGIVLESGRGILDLLYNYGVSGEIILSIRAPSSCGECLACAGPEEKLASKAEADLL